MRSSAGRIASSASHCGGLLTPAASAGSRSCSLAYSASVEPVVRSLLGVSWSTSSTVAPGSITTAPLVGVSLPASSRSWSDLPQPDSPSTPIRWPRRTPHVCGESTSRSSSKRMLTLENRASSSPSSPAAFTPFCCICFAKPCITRRRQARISSGLLPAASGGGSARASSSCHTPKPRGALLDAPTPPNPRAISSEESAQMTRDARGRRSVLRVATASACAVLTTNAASKARAERGHMDDNEKDHRRKLFPP